MRLVRTLLQIGDTALRRWTWSTCLLAQVVPLLVLAYFSYGHAVFHRTLVHSAGMRVLDLAWDVDRYRETFGDHPVDLQALADLEHIGKNSSWLLDPWGRPFRYAVVDGVVNISSLGANGAPGGRLQARDVSTDGSPLDPPSPTPLEYVLSGKPLEFTLLLLLPCGSTALAMKLILLRPLADRRVPAGHVFLAAVIYTFGLWLGNGLLSVATLGWS